MSFRGSDVCWRALGSSPGILVQRFHILERPLRGWFQEDLRDIVHTYVMQYDCWGKIWKAWRGCTSLHYAQFHWVKLSFVRSFRNIRNWGGQWWDRPFLGSVFCLWHGHAEFLWTFLTQAGPCRTYLFYEFVNKFSDIFFWKRSAWLDALLRYGVIDILDGAWPLHALRCTSTLKQYKYPLK